jgi:hypothetical protein
MTLSPPHVGAFCGGRFSEEKANGVTARPGTWFAEWQKSLDLLGNLAFFRENSRVSYANLQHWCICSIGAFAALVHLQHRCICSIGDDGSEASAKLMRPWGR